MKTLKFLALAILTLACLPLVVVAALVDASEPFRLTPWVKV
jgi:hypothetical protein